jgi:hypothetical protein
MNNQRYAATEREQTRLNVTLFVNVFSIFWVALPAHNGLVAGSSPDEPSTISAADHLTVVRASPQTPEIRRS